MKKEKALNDTENVKIFHSEQLEEMTFLAHRISIKQECISLNDEQCLFNQWLKDYKKFIIEEWSENMYERLKNSHTQWHEEQKKICNIFFAENNKQSFLSRLFTPNREITELDEEKAKAYLAELKKISKVLLSNVSLIETRLKAMPNDYLENL